MARLQAFLSHPKTPLLLLIGLIAAYTLYFSWYTINRHNTLNSYAADLSLIDQPMWNTVLGPGGFMEQTWGERQQPRLAEHFEPILIPLALLFFLWDDVRILLIAQTLALALGALPVFWIAKKQLTITNSPRPPRPPAPSLPSYAALAFALAYLLFPQLQAANIADFHADPFVVAPLLFAFWYATERRWGWMWLWAIIAMSTKETLPTLTAMLGLYLLLDHLRTKKQSPLSPAKRPNLARSQSPLLHALLLILTSSAWFLIATFLIVGPLAGHYFGTDGPIYLANRYSGGRAGLLPLLSDPARWHYLLGLLAAAGFLPLLAPELLLLGLPVLVANLLSNFPGQYSGEQHYSAPLVAAFILAAIYGTGRLLRSTSLREINGQPLRTGLLIGATLWLLSWSVGYQARFGWTPLSVRTERYAMSAAAERLPALLAQIPAEAAVSASAGLHPHVAHRRRVYVFPTVAEADYLLVDVTDIPGVHPNDAQAKIMDLLQSDWHLIEASHGLLLARKAAPVMPAPLPDRFFEFARATARPTYATPLTLGDGRLQFLGYDLLDDPDDGVVFRLYWQATAPLPDDLRLWPLVYDDLGQLPFDPAQVPQIATVWYPPAAWQPGEIIVTETLPQLLPDTFHLALAAGPPDSLSDPARLLEIQAAHTDPPARWRQVGTFRRQGPFLLTQSPAPTLRPLTAVEADFADEISLTGFGVIESDQPHPQSLTVLLAWRAHTRPAADYTVFVHLLGPEGQRVAQSDAFPTWLFPQPTSQWPPGQTVLDRHILLLPGDLPPGRYTLQAGLYDGQTLARLPLAGGDEVVTLTQIELE